MRNSMFNRLIVTPLICLAAGIVAIVIGTMIYTIPDDYVDTTSVITAIDSYDNGSDETEHIVMVEYEVEGKTYNQELGMWASNYDVGKEVKIMCNPENPEEMVPASKLPKIIFIGFGILFILFGIGQVLGILIRGR